MEENKEKKEIKINLWTFYVLVASLVMLLAATVSGWMLVVKQNMIEEQMNLKNSISVQNNIEQ